MFCCKPFKNINCISIIEISKRGLKNESEAPCFDNAFSFIYIFMKNKQHRLNQHKIIQFSESIHSPHFNIFDVILWIGYNLSFVNEHKFDKIDLIKIIHGDARA